MDPNAQTPQPGGVPAEGQVITPQTPPETEVAQPEPQVAMPPPPQPEQPVDAPQPVAPPDPLVAPEPEVAPPPMPTPPTPDLVAAAPIVPAMPNPAVASVDQTTANPGKSLGVVSLILSLFPVIAIGGLVLGFMAMSKSKKAGMSNKYALIGIVLSILNIVAVTGVFVMMTVGSQS